MANNSKIEWTDATWNPVVGCSIVSTGCKNCYAMRTAARLATMGGKTGAKYQGLTKDSKTGPVWNGRVRLDFPSVDTPSNWNRPRRIFVNSMSDLFHESLSDSEISQVFAAMQSAPQHIYQILTKRAPRMHHFMRHWSGHIPNLWLGVSVEDQTRASERIPYLLETPGAAIRWVSAEPLLGPINLSLLVVTFPGDQLNILDALRGKYARKGSGDLEWSAKPFHDNALDWVVTGGESQSRSRPMHPAWVRALRDNCEQTGTPFLFKQWGDWFPTDLNWQAPTITIDKTGMICPEDSSQPDLARLARIGKHKAGRKLDGRIHDDYPTTEFSEGL